jgi:hypothetical protein
LTVPAPDRLPADTWVLVNWHGVASAAQVKGTNPVMKLWNDPQFATAREQVITLIADAMGEDTKPRNRDEIDNVLAVLENPAVIGVAGDPLEPGADTVHAYAVFNRKGKETEWTRIRASQKVAANSKVSRVPIGGVQVRKTTTTTVPVPKSDSDQTSPPPRAKVSYSLEASLGDYELYSDDQSLMESLITRLKDAAPAADSLLKDSTYQQAQRFRADGPMLEAFIKVPNLAKLPIPLNDQINMETTLRELHPERLQGVWLSAGMGRDRMLIRGALLGDMSPGSVFDLIGGNTKTFLTLASAPATETFAAVRLDLQSFYAMALKAVKAGMPPDRAAAASMMIDSMVVSQTGLRASELLAQFTGELAVASNGDEAGDSGLLPTAVMFPLTNGEQVLTSMRNFAAALFAKEKKVSGATLVEIDMGTAERPESLFLAVAKNMLVIGSNDVEMGKLLARNATGADSPAGSVAADTKFLLARKDFPAELNSISYTDFARLNWESRVQAIQKKMTDQKQVLLDRAQSAEKGGENAPPDPALAARLRNQADSLGGFEKALVEILPLAQKHLKISIGGSWKAADGVFYDSYVN